MIWDVEKNMIVDSAYDETADMGNSEMLVGFEFEAEVLQEVGRPTQTSAFMPEDSDSVSTFQSFQSRFNSKATQSTTNTPTPVDSTAHSNTTTSTLTSTTPATSAAYSSLVQQMSSQQQQFNYMQAMLQQLLSSQQASLPSDDSNDTRGAQARSGGEQ